MTTDTDPCPPQSEPTKPDHSRPEPSVVELMVRLEVLASAQAIEMQALSDLGARFEVAYKRFVAAAADVSMLAHEIRRHGGLLASDRTDLDNLPCRKGNGGLPSECPEAIRYVR